MKSSNRDFFLLVLIIVAGSALRLWRPFEIPFTHDEFSAIFRTNFNSFSELLEKGIKVDGHPAGVQTFLYYYTKLFGYNELVVKLPFIIAGIASIYLLFKIGSLWFNSTVGLVSASFLATLQYTVMYSQIARPYSSGLFFSLLMVYFWTKLILFPKNRFIPNGIGYIIASTLCSYNHHFSLLFAGIVGLTGLIIVQPGKRKQFAFLILAIIVLYIPHLPVFLAQVKLGGIEGWLAKPKNDFIIDYLKYLFHYSIFLYLIVIALLIFSILKGSFSKSRKFLLVAFGWFLIPFLIGFLYSKYINAVIQFSVLIFSFPFLLLFIFGMIPELKFNQKLLTVFLILSVSIYTLSAKRKHYSVFYDSPYEQIIIEHHSLKKKHGSQLLSLIDVDPRKTEYYIQKQTLNSSFIQIDSSVTHVIETIKGRKENLLYFGCTAGSNPLIVPVIQEYFPYLMEQKDYFTGTSFLFSKSQPGNIPNTHSVTTNSFEAYVNGWSEGTPTNYVDSISLEGKRSYLMDSSMEWGPTYSIDFDKLNFHENDFIDMSVSVKLLSGQGAILLVSVIEEGEKTIDWRAEKLSTFSSVNNDGWIKIYNCIKLSDLQQDISKATLKVFIWKQDKSAILLDEFKINVRQGNPIIYGLFEKL